MSRVLQKADDFLEDFALRALWYVREAGPDVARRFQESVDATLQQLSQHNTRSLAGSGASGIPNSTGCAHSGSRVRSTGF